MAVYENNMSPQVKALKTTDLSPMVRMGNIMVPRLLNGFLPKLDEKQKKAFDKVLPVGGEKKFYVHLTDTPTPPIVIRLAQPPVMTTRPEVKVRQEKIRGIRLSTLEIQLLQTGQTLANILRLLWRLKSQLFTMLHIMLLFLPFLLLGPSELRDLRRKAAVHFKPLAEFMPATPKPAHKRRARAAVY